MRTATDIEEALRAHGASVWRACIVHFESTVDAEDAYQETFLRYALADDRAFSSTEHCKAWLIRVATNVCRDMLKSASRRNISLESNATASEPVNEDRTDQPGSFTSDVVDALRSLDDPPRTPVYLSTCEEYSAPEIAKLLDAPVNTVYTWIARGKRALREALS